MTFLPLGALGSACPCWMPWVNAGTWPRRFRCDQRGDRQHRDDDAPPISDPRRSCGTLLFHGRGPDRRRWIVTGGIGGALAGSARVYPPGSGWRRFRVSPTTVVLVMLSPASWRDGRRRAGPVWLLT